MTHETILAAADLADQRRSTWRHTVLRTGLLVAVRGPSSQRRPAAFMGLFVVLNSVGVPAPPFGAAGPRIASFTAVPRWNGNRG
jgi:hypothetical protein